MILTIRSLIVPTGTGTGTGGIVAGAWAAATVQASASGASRRAFRMPGIIRAHPVSLLPFCQWLAETPGSIALHESLYMYPLVESTHVLALCLFVGMAAIFDLRLLGVALRNVPVTEIKRRLNPWMAAGFVGMGASGVLLFYAIPVRSYQNIFFRIKVVLRVLAGLNAFVFHTSVDRRIAVWDLSAVPPPAARRAGAVSLLLWTIIIVCGRMIAYHWFDCDKQPQPRAVNLLTGCVVPQGGGR